MVLATELGDLSRFANPRQFMAYIGVAPEGRTPRT
jgi:transposase